MYNMQKSLYCKMTMFGKKDQKNTIFAQKNIDRQKFN